LTALQADLRSLSRVSVRVCGMADASELPIQTEVSALQLADAMFGTGITVVSATYNGDPALAGIFTNDDKSRPKLRLRNAG
jgi:hypothetical protein